MLDDVNILTQHDCLKDLELAAIQYEQASFDAVVIDAEHDGRKIENMIITGMGGSALSADVLKTWLSSEINVPIEIIRSYDLPNYANENTLVIISSYSGNTEETISCFEQAMAKKSQVAIVASGGKLIKAAQDKNIAHVILPGGLQPRMALIYTLCAFTNVLANFKIVADDKVNEIHNKYEWLKSETAKWRSEVPCVNNFAKQLALKAVGKIGAFYGGTVSFPVTYKFKICCTETAKNVAMYNSFPEFDHNEIMGWTSHPIEKPFAVFNIISNLEHPQILKRFEITDRLLSGMRPSPTEIKLAGGDILSQLLWGSILADFFNIYLAVLNGVNPMNVDIIEKLKTQLV